MLSAKVAEKPASRTMRMSFVAIATPSRIPRTFTSPSCPPRIMSRRSFPLSVCGSLWRSIASAFTWCMQSNRILENLRLSTELSSEELCLSIASEKLYFSCNNFLYHFPCRAQIFSRVEFSGFFRKAFPDCGSHCDAQISVNVYFLHSDFYCLCNLLLGNSFASVYFCAEFVADFNIFSKD